MSEGGSGAALGKLCYEQRKCVCGCCGCLFLAFIIILSISFGTISPTEYGMRKNTITGQVDLGRTYDSGRYFLGPFAEFRKFPACYVTLSFGNDTYSSRNKDGRDDRPIIPARTGADSSNEGSSSGGQPVDLSVSFQYQLVRDEIPQMYTLFGGDLETRNKYEDQYLVYAQQAITNVAQMFTPSAFWIDRKSVERAMFVAVNRSLYTRGHAILNELQLRAVGFKNNYEQTIINIQLQEQLRVTKSYQLDVTVVVKQVDLLQSETDANVVEINAEAARERAVIEGQASARALQIEQQARATMYARLRSHLGWSAEQFLQYIKMKALNAQPQSNVVVGVNPLGSVTAS